MISKLRARLRSERGQVLILFVGIFTIIAIVGVITVDFGLWFSERRGAQRDADLSALAGAQEYERQLAVPSYPEDALGKATDFFNDNNTSNTSNASLPVPIEAVSPCVKVTVKHDTKALFTSIFGIGPNNIGASAKACAGDITGTTGVIPIEMSTTNDPCFINGHPNYTALCLIESGSTSCPAASGSEAGRQPRAPRNTPRPTRTPRPTDTPAPTRTPRRTDTPTPTITPGPSPTPSPTSTPAPPPCNPHGILDLQTSDNFCSDSNGSGNIEDVIRDGNGGTCRVNEGNTCDPDHNGPWYDCVAVQNGNTNNVLDGIRQRLALQGPCDTDGDGIDGFSEAVDRVDPPVVPPVPPSQGLYEARACDSPRIITIIVLDTNPPPGNTGYPIRGFAAMYLLGCWDSEHDGPPPSDPALFDQNCSNQGHQEVYGEFLNLTVTNADVGTPTPGGTLFGIALVE